MLSVANTDSHILEEKQKKTLKGKRKSKDFSAYL